MTSHHHPSPRIRTGNDAHPEIEDPSRNIKALLRTFPDSMPLQARVDGVLGHRHLPGGKSFQALEFLQSGTLVRHWDRANPHQAVRLHNMVTKAIGGEYRNWRSFQEDLRAYLREFGFVRFIDEEPVKLPPTIQAESEDSRA